MANNLSHHPQNAIKHTKEPFEKMYTLSWRIHTHKSSFQKDYQPNLEVFMCEKIRKTNTEAQSQQGPSVLASFLPLPTGCCTVTVAEGHLRVCVGATQPTLVAWDGDQHNHHATES